MALYSSKQRDAVIANALKAADAHAAGKKSIKLGSGVTTQTLDLATGGYCCRFVRQCFETALGMREFQWLFGSPSAKQTGEKMKAADVGRVSAGLVAGDVLVWYEGSGPYGHIAIYLGDVYGDGRKLVAENTSSGKRGFPQAPGTKVTRLSSMRKGYVAYRLFAGVA